LPSSPNDILRIPFLILLPKRKSPALPVDTVRFTPIAPINHDRYPDQADYADRWSKNRPPDPPPSNNKPRVENNERQDFNDDRSEKDRREVGHDY